MDARPLPERVARALEVAHLDAVLIGNAGAALQGAPVTTPLESLKGQTCGR